MKVHLRCRCARHRVMRFRPWARVRPSGRMAEVEAERRRSFRLSPFVRVVPVSQFAIAPRQSAVGQAYRDRQSQHEPGRQLSVTPDFSGSGTRRSGNAATGVRFARRRKEQQRMKRESGSSPGMRLSKTRNPMANEKAHSKSPPSAAARASCQTTRLEVASATHNGGEGEIS